MGEHNLTWAAEKNAADIRVLEELAEGAVHECYQCGKCSAGCPMGESMDVMPRQVIRMLQLGLLEEAMAARSPWVCATCHTCSARCPKEVPITRIMEAVRQMADARGIHPVPDAAAFTGDFLLPLRWFGSSHELTMTALYNLGSGHIFQNFEYLPKMLASGKLRLVPERIKGRAQVRRIMKNCAAHAGAVLGGNDKEGAK